MEQHYIVIALVGRSGIGKSTLIVELTKHFYNLRILKGYTTRAPRDPAKDPHDHLFYDFITPEALREMSEEGKLLQFDEPHPGNMKATSFVQVDDACLSHIGIVALSEQGVRNFRAAGLQCMPSK